MIASPRPDEPERSFSERYADMPTGPTPTPVKPDDGKGGGRGRTRILAGGGLAIVVVAGALVGSQLLQQIGSSKNLPSAPASAALASIDPAKGVVDRFWAVVTDPGLSYHVTSSGRWSGPDGSSSFTSSLDVAGGGYAGVITAKGRGKPVTSRVIRIDPFTWTRTGKASWTRITSNDPKDRSQPFLFLDSPSALAYAGAVARNGQNLHLLRSTDAYQPYVAGLLNLGTFLLSKDVIRLEIYVTDQGVPVEADFLCDGGGMTADGKPVFRGSAQRMFSKFGSKFTIAPPAS
jgi:hypothetical protein